MIGDIGATSLYRSVDEVGRGVFSDSQWGYRLVEIHEASGTSNADSDGTRSQRYRRRCSRLVWQVSRAHDRCVRVRSLCSLNRCRWPDDPEPMWLPPDPIEGKEQPVLDEWPWNATEAKEIADGAKQLLEKLPIIAEHWHQQSRYLSKNPRETLLRLQDVLRACLPLIEYPLGEVEPAVGIPKASKQWQHYALLIARRAIWVLNKVGHNRPSLDRNSIVARVVHETMKRMQIRDIQTVTTSGVSAFLIRWHNHFGLVPESLESNDHKGLGEACGPPSRER
jgi:hypothetical protein